MLSEIAPPAGIYALADHLDGALAAGEDLLGVRLQPVADLAPEVAPETALADAIQQLRRLEAALLLHLLQARRRAAEIVNADGEMKAVLRLVGVTTESLLGLVETFAPEKMSGLSPLGDVQDFLRQRGIIAPDAAGLGAFKGIEIDDRYRVGGMIELGPLLDMAASALDLLETRYDLYGGETPAMSAAVAVPPIPVDPSTWDEADVEAVQVDDADAVSATPSDEAVAAASSDAVSKTETTVESVAAMRTSLKAALDEINGAPH